MGDQTTDAILPAADPDGDGGRTGRTEGSGGTGSGVADERGDRTGPSGANGAGTPDESCVHAGTDVRGMSMETPPIVPPLFQAAVFKTPTLETVDAAIEGRPGTWAYSRAGNPTVDALERAVAELEGAEACVAAASGMGTITTVLRSHLSAGDTLVTTRALYGVSRRWIDDELPTCGVTVEHIGMDDLPSELPAGTRVLYTETVANPLLEVADLPRLAELAHRGGALLVVDGTFAPPTQCRAHRLGADIVIHSATKYLGGHGDLILGVAAGHAEHIDPARHQMVTEGAPAAPMAAWLALRGIRTLHLRSERAARNAAAAADLLADHEAVAVTYYPGLAEHPTHGVARRILTHGGGMVSFELRGGRPAVERFLGALRMIELAPSLADVGTTVSIPATTSHRAVPHEERAAQGITDGLVRLSCGLESAGAICADLQRGLDAAAG